MAVNGPGLLMVGAGSVLVYAGIKGYSPAEILRSLATGKSPSNLTQTNPISGGSGISAGTGSAIANDALQYQGAGYRWAGAPANGIGNWDCSSFVNWVVGHDESMAIPGFAAGTYDGSTHGPTTLSWLAWSGCTTVGHSASDAQAGDICVWQTHMGIATGSGSMISAENAQLGTQVSAISMPGEILSVRRLNAAVSAGPAVGGTSGNRALGQQMAAARGRTGQQWTALDQLWEKESTWSNTAENPTSGAYGIAQANPPTKMPHAGQKSGGSNAAVQIQWGLNYIAGRYGNPVNAWDHEQQNGWY